MANPTLDIVIRPGKTFEETFFYASDEYEHKPVQSVLSVVPLRLQVTDHGLPSGFWVATVKSEKAPHALGKDVFVRALDEDTLELQDIEPCDWPWPKSGAHLVLAYPKPVDLAGWVFRGQIRDKPGGQLLFRWHSDPSQNPEGAIVLGESRLTLKVSPEASAAMAFRQAVYDLEAVTPAGDVYPVVGLSAVCIEPDVTEWDA